MKDFEQNIVFEPDGKPKGTIVRGQPAFEDMGTVEEIENFLNQFSPEEITNAKSLGFARREADLEYQEWFEENIGGRQ